MTKWLAEPQLRVEPPDGVRRGGLAQEVVNNTEDAREGMTAFMERRPPEFRGW